MVKNNVLAYLYPERLNRHYNKENTMYETFDENMKELFRPSKSIRYVAQVFADTAKIFCQDKWIKGYFYEFNPKAGEKLNLLLKETWESKCGVGEFDPQIRCVCCNPLWAGDEFDKEPVLRDFFTKNEEYYHDYLNYLFYR